MISLTVGSRGRKLFLKKGKASYCLISAIEFILGPSPGLAGTGSAAEIPILCEGKRKATCSDPQRRRMPSTALVQPHLAGTKTSDEVSIHQRKPSLELEEPISLEELWKDESSKGENWILSKMPTPRFRKVIQSQPSLYFQSQSQWPFTVPKLKNSQKWKSLLVHWPLGTNRV